MDALAADRMLGEFPPQAYAFGSYRTDKEAKPKDREPQQKIEWKAKGVIPILYDAPHHDHSALHRTLDLWAQTYRDGIQGKESIVTEYALTKPSASTQQDDYVRRMIWALSDRSGKPAKLFAEIDPVPPLEWLEAFSEDCFSHSDLSQFDIPPFKQPDENLKFSLLRRPVNYSHAPENWRYVAPLVAQMPDELLSTLAHSATWWLQSASEKKLNCHEDLFFELCRRYLAIDYQNEVDDKRDPVSHSINHPVGHITQALINIWFLRQPNDNDGLPSDIKPLLTKLCGSEKAQYRHGRVVLASRLISLFRIDRAWTEQYLLPFLSWQSSESEARATWMGFLWSPRIYWPLLTVCKDNFLETAKHYDVLGTWGAQYINLLAFAALDPASTFTTDEYRSAIDSLPQSGLEIAAGALLSALEGAGEQREQYWQNRIRPYWQEIWPKDRQKMSTSIAQNLAQLSISAGDEFPDALATFIDWLQTFDPHYILHLLGKSDLCSKFPQDVLTLLDRIIGNPSYSYSELGECLDNIGRAWPPSQAEPRYRRLHEFR
jgi:hypothetical protein